MLLRPTLPITAAIAAAFTIVLTAGCFTGQRPTLIDRPEIDDPAAVAVIDRLGTAATAEFSAVYEITPTSTGSTSTATVARRDDRVRVSVTDSDRSIDYAVDGASSRTCSLQEQTCSDFLDDARISDLNITHRFWGDAFLTRLELDAGRRIGFSEAASTTIAGAPAACVDISVPAAPDMPGTVRYCALDAGPLARYVGADVTIELIDFDPVAADEAFVP